MGYFTVHIDDSGTAPSQAVANATALIIPAKRIIAMEKEWTTLKEKEGFTDFHTSEFVARNYKSEFGKWDDTKQKRVFLRIRQIIKKYGVKAYSFSVHKYDYDAAIPSDMRNFTGKYHYTWAMRHIMTFLDKWRGEHRANPFEFIFDWAERRDPSRREIETVMEQAERIAVDKYGIVGRYNNYSFRHRKDLAGLQCVDLLAWTCYRHALLKFRNTPMLPLADVAWNDFIQHGNGPKDGAPTDWLTALTLKKKSLQDWITREIADGRSIKRFQEWEKEKAAKKKST